LFAFISGILAGFAILHVIFLIAWFYLIHLFVAIHHILAKVTFITWLYWAVLFRWGIDLDVYRVSLI
ncbi:MAG TPA: hypothetical protein VIH57_02865, partial [Bacteroidales bacterium]